MGQSETIKNKIQKETKTNIKIKTVLNRIQRVVINN